MAEEIGPFPLPCCLAQIRHNQLPDATAKQKGTQQQLCSWGQKLLKLPDAMKTQQQGVSWGRWQCGRNEKKPLINLFLFLKTLKSLLFLLFRVIINQNISLESSQARINPQSTGVLSVHQSLPSKSFPVVSVQLVRWLYVLIKYKFF